jgi:hypothetical protein
MTGNKQSDITAYFSHAQWRTQEFFFGGGFNKFSGGQRTERTGIWGR